MTVENYNANQLWLQLVKNQHKINFVLVVLLSIFLLAYAAELTWRLWPQPAQTNSASVVVAKTPSKTSTGNKLNLAAIKRLNLFGDLTAKPVEEKPITEAPVTKLNLTLTGVVTSSVKDQGAAIIENRSQQQVYGVGEKIEGTNATLKEVYVDRVIIKNGVISETLMLEGIDYNKQSSNSSSNNSRQPTVSRASRNEAGTDRRTLSSDALNARREISQKPTSFTDYIAVSPYRPDGELVGYRVKPGKKSALFKEVGLKSGDVVIDINGLDLTDIQQGLEAMNLLRESQSLQMTIQRKDEFMTIYLDLPEGEQ